MLMGAEFALVLLAFLAVSSTRTGLEGPGMWGRPPGGAVALWAAVAIVSVTQFVVSGWLDALMRDPDQIREHGQVWRLGTAMFVQDGGVPGTVFNLVVLAVVAVPAARYFGSGLLWALFLGLGIVFNLIGTLYGSSGAGNSGATMAVACALVGHTFGAWLRDRRLVETREALFCLIPLVVGAAAWAWFDYHGEAEVVGWLVGLVLGLALPTRYPRTRQAG